MFKVNGETLVDETTEGGQDVNLSVKKEGDKPAEVKYEVNKKKTSAAVKGSAVVKGESKKDTVTKKIEREAKLKKVTERLSRRDENFMARLEVFFTKLRDLFSK